MKPEPIRRLIDRSSLGAPPVKELRSRTPKEVVRRILARADDRLPRGTRKA